MDFSGFNWSLMTIIGPIVLVVAIAFAALRNRASRRRRAETEQATHDLYDAEQRAHPRSGGGSV